MQARTDALAHKPAPPSRHRIGAGHGRRAGLPGADDSAMAAMVNVVPDDHKV
jgi:hypothetical protein